MSIYTLIYQDRLILEIIIKDQEMNTHAVHFLLQLFPRNKNCAFHYYHGMYIIIVSNSVVPYIPCRQITGHYTDLANIVSALKKSNFDFMGS